MIPVRSRWAVSAIFFINGVVMVSWVPHIPAVKAKHALSDGTPGAVLLCMALGAVLALPLGAILVLFGAAGSGYLGLLVGPPLIGFAAEAAGLPAGLGIVSILCALIAVYVTRVVPDRPFANARNLRILGTGPSVQRQ